MLKETLKRMETFKGNPGISAFQVPEPYASYLQEYKEVLFQWNGGCGMVDDNSYLHLWKQEEIPEMTQIYEDFLTGVVVIGTDGGDTTYGVNSKGEYVEFPFLGINNDIKKIAHDFDGFIKYLAEYDWDDE